LAAARAAKYDIVVGFMALFAFNAIYANGKEHLAVACGLKNSPGLKILIPLRA